MIQCQDIKWKRDKIKNWLTNITLQPELEKLLLQDSIFENEFWNKLTLLRNDMRKGFDINRCVTITSGEFSQSHPKDWFERPLGRAIMFFHSEAD
jgi:hypothetical protein